MTEVERECRFEWIEAECKFINEEISRLRDRQAELNRLHTELCRPRRLVPRVVLLRA